MEQGQEHPRDEYYSLIIAVKILNLGS